MQERRTQSPREEIANSVSHGIGFVAALAALPVLVMGAMDEGASAIVGAAIFGSAVAILYLTSTVYHALPPRRAKHVFRVLDHAAIYLLIAGTYTPLALLMVGGAWGWSLFGVQWGLALIGVAVLLTLHRTPPWIHQAAYILLGWTALLALPHIDGLPLPALFLVVGGGVAYTGGATLYWRDRRGTWAIGDHGLWHLLVLAGALAHLAFVLLYVL